MIEILAISSFQLFLFKVCSLLICYSFVGERS